MGGIDLDPASCTVANQTVQAARYYTRADNGLLQPWSGRVWCNPPYSQEVPGTSAIRAWVEKAVQCSRQREMEQCTLLIPNDTSTRWFAWLWTYPICFPPTRIKFVIPGKKPKQPTFGSCFIYLGPHRECFMQVFSRFGPVVDHVYSRVEVSTTLWEVSA